jgi:methylenetetrahydrofolate dehydrogenase (NADP+)/methenyltetrahydrofolate cyclohydrolase
MAKAIQEDAARLNRELYARTGVSASLAVVRVGANPASVRYADQIRRLFNTAGVGFRLVDLPTETDDRQLVATLTSLNAEADVSGILLQLPLPPAVSPDLAAAAIDPGKDVDGIATTNAGRLYLGRGRFFAPATPAGGIAILERAGIVMAGRQAVVVGRSAIVGRPLALLLLARNATVTVCHSHTRDLARLTRQADILAVAVGRPSTITVDMVAPGATVLDFGINVFDGRVVGDVDYLGVVETAGAITPVPGGTGPMTNAMLLQNTVQAALWQAE